MCCTVGCPVAVFGPDAGLNTVAPFELDITAAAAAPKVNTSTQEFNKQEEETLLHLYILNLMLLSHIPDIILFISYSILILSFFVS